MNLSIFDFALKMELDGEAYYRDLANKSSNDGLKYILNMLADEEIKHYNFLIKLEEDTNSQKLDKVDLFYEVKKKFGSIKNKKDLITFEDEEVAFYKEAIEKEKYASNYYLEQAKTCKDERAKEILLALAKEEDKHRVILENLYDFITEPQRWLADAEWNSN